MKLTHAQEVAVHKYWQGQMEIDYNKDCVDNERYATKGNAEEMAEYEEMRRHGCCGSEDVELVCDDGTTLMYGFNYGH